MRATSQAVLPARAENWTQGKHPSSVQSWFDTQSRTCETLTGWTGRSDLDGQTRRDGQDMPSSENSKSRELSQSPSLLCQNQ